MMEERVILLRAEKYEAEWAEGPRLLADGFGHVRSSEDGIDGPAFRVYEPACMRFLCRAKGDTGVGEWLARRPAFWLGLLPIDSRLYVRSHGWPQLWALGYPKQLWARFEAIESDDVCAAVVGNPLSAAWWLECLGSYGEHGEQADYYFAFLDHVEGSDPLAITYSDTIDRLEDRVVGEYGAGSVEVRVLGPNSLRDSLEEINRWAQE